MSLRSLILMLILVSFEVIQIWSFWESQLISRKFAACSLQSFSKVTSKYDHVSKVYPSTDIFVFKYALFVFLCLSQFQVGTSPGQPQGKSFWAS